MRGLRLAGARS